jgi:hypothetical protein
MQNYSFVIALRIWHPELDPQVITNALGMTPDITHKAGEPRITRQGRALGGTYARSHWSADPFQRGEYLSHQDQVVDVLIDATEALARHKDFLLSLRETGAHLHLQVSSHSNRNYAFELPPNLLGACAELGLSIVHDVYPYPQNW